MHADDEQGIRVSIESCGCPSEPHTCDTFRDEGPTPTMPYGAVICIRCQRWLGNETWTAPICASCFSAHTEPDSELGKAAVAWLGSVVLLPLRAAKALWRVLFGA